MAPDAENGKVRWPVAAAVIGAVLVAVAAAYLMGVRSATSPAPEVAEPAAMAEPVASTYTARCWLVTGVEMLEPIDCLSRGGRLKEPLRPAQAGDDSPGDTLPGSSFASRGDRKAPLGWTPHRTTRLSETPPSGGTAASYSGAGSRNRERVSPSSSRSGRTSARSSPRSSSEAIRSSSGGIRSSPGAVR